MQKELLYSYFSFFEIARQTVLSTFKIPKVQVYFIPLIRNTSHKQYQYNFLSFMSKR